MRIETFYDPESISIYEYNHVHAFIGLDLQLWHSHLLKTVFKLQ